MLPKTAIKDFIEGKFHELRMVFVKKLTILLCFFVFNSFASINITSFNIRNFDKKGKGTDKTELHRILKNLNSDVIAVQEIYNNKSFQKFTQRYLPQYRLLLSTCGGGGQQKLGFLYKDEKVELIKHVEDGKISDPDGVVTGYGCGSLRPAMLGFFKERKSNKKFVAISVHLKAGSGTKNYAKRARQYKYITKMLRSLRLANHKNIVVIGDFNTTGYDLRDQDYKKFNYMLGQTGTDTASKNISCSSYWSGQIYTDDIEEPSTLDHIVYTKKFMGMSLKSVKVGSHCQVANCQEVYDSVLGRSYEAVSDHCPVTASFE